MSRWCKKDRMILLILVGALMMVIRIPEKEGDREETDTTTDSEYYFSTEQYVERTERNLEQLLSQVDGIGEVNVMITLKNSSEKVVEKDKENTQDLMEEEDSEGGTRSTKQSADKEATVFTMDRESAEGEGTPYVTKELSPVVEGVVVVAEGGDDPRIAAQIHEAVQALFSVESHRIKIMKGIKKE